MHPPARSDRVAGGVAFASAAELRALIRDRQISPVEMTEVLLGRIERIDPRVNAYCTVATEQALAAARVAKDALRRGDVIGPLHGVPVAIKDMVPTAGIRTTFGSRLYAEHVPSEDALEVARLKRAGAVVVGKTNTPEFAAGPNTVNALFGATRNPWDLERSAGGSSGGSAVALACGLAPLASGSDLGGSLRIPASLCGVVGLRPSPGRVPIYPAAWTSEPFAVSGPMARTVGDAALMLSVMAGPDDRVPISLDEPGAVFERAAEGDVSGLKIAWSHDLGIASVEGEVAEIVASACTRLLDAGCHVEPAQPQIGEIRPLIATMRALSTAAGSPELLERAERVDNTLLREFLQRPRELDALRVAEALREHSRHVERMSAFFREHDLLVTPTTPTAAYMLDQMHAPEIAGEPVADAIDAMLLTYAITMAGLPAISVPAGFTASGLPVGVQIVGSRHADALVLRAAAAFEQLAPWSHLHPAIATADLASTQRPPAGAEDQRRAGPRSTQHGAQPSSTTNVELVRSIYAGWERGDFSSAEWADPEIQYVIADGPAPGTWTGVAGMKAGWREFLGAFVDLRGEAEEYRAVDEERVLVLYHLSGSGRTSGLELEHMRARGASIFHVRDGKVTKLVQYLDNDHAQADLGF